MSARSTSQGRRCSCNCSPSQTQSPSARPRGVEVATWLKEDSSTRQSRSRGQCSHSRHRSTCHRTESWWHQSPLLPGPHSGTSPSRPGRYSLPSPSPLHPHHADEQLNHSLSDLHLHPQQWESRSRTQIGGTPMHTAGHPCSLPRPVAECQPLGLV